MKISSTRTGLNVISALTDSSMIFDATNWDYCWYVPYSAVNSLRPVKKTVADVGGSKENRILKHFSFRKICTKGNV